MGNSHSGGDSMDVNYFSTSRNDIPTQPSNAHNEVYSDYKPASSHHGRSGQDCATIHVRDGKGGDQIIYAEAGSTININVNEGGHERRIGGSQSGYIPNYEANQQRYMDQRQAAYLNPREAMYPRPYYGQQQGYDDYGYRNVSGRGGYDYEYQQQQRRDPVGNFFGTLLGGLAVGAGIGLGSRVFGGHRGYGYDRGYAYERPCPPGYDTGYYPQQNYYPQPSYYRPNYAYSTPDYGYSSGGYYPGGGYYGYGRGRGGSGNFIAGAVTGAVVGSLLSNGRNGYYS